MNKTNKKILIVDDNPYIRKILTMMLKLENLEVETASDGSEALNIIISKSKGEFDIIVTDYQMPIINGQELAETLKKYDEYKNIPIVLVTQVADIKYENDDKYRVFDKILHKPVAQEIIVETINILLGRNGNS